MKAFFIVVKIISTITIGLVFLFGTNMSASMTIPVSNGYCKYSITLPQGWDTIPRTVLQANLNMANIDLAIYPISQKKYFRGNYVVFMFTPTLKPLTEFSFKQITEEIGKQSKQGEIVNDTLNIHLIKSYTESQGGIYSMYSYYKIIHASDSLENCQKMYLTKFGYISVLSYKKVDGQFSLDGMSFLLADVISVQPDYAYIEPARNEITLLHLLISIGIGVIVYGLITFLPKLKNKK